LRPTALAHGALMHAALEPGLETLIKTAGCCQATPASKRNCK
jgi:hypothetical protein